MKNKIKVGIAQYGSVHLNLQDSIEKLASIINEASTEDLDLLVFGETWLSGYPSWLDDCPEVAQWDNEATKEAYLQLRNSSISIPGPETEMIAKLCKANSINLVLGANEIVHKGKGSGTVFNALLTFGKDGNLLNHHRKLVPTYTEKMIYGHGDAHGLQAVETSAGRVGGLVCWEHWMPITRQIMHDSAEDIHIAVWPTVHDRHQVASRQYAFEGRCFVLAAGQLLKVSDYPKELKLREDLRSNRDQYALKGGSCIINPRGEYIVEPVFEKEGLIMAEIDLDQRVKEQMTLDVSGHYQRPDLFKLEVNRERLI